MTPASHRFRLGDFQCVALLDGNFNYPLGAFFANAPPDRLKDILRSRGLPSDRIATPYTCLLVDTGSHRVMVDTGAGALGAAADAFFPGIDHTTTETGHLPAGLRAEGIDPRQVDTVFITHAHPDHIGGTVDGEGNLLFPEARFFMLREEWEFWMSASAEAAAPPPMVAVARRALEPLRDRIVLLEDGDEVVPGIRALATPGHTPGHAALEISSAGEVLLHISDVVLHPLHLENPEWVPVFDTNAEEAAASKRRIFDRAADERTLIFAHHFPPFPSVGRVSRAAGGWRWEPISAIVPGPGGPPGLPLTA